MRMKVDSLSISEVFSTEKRSYVYKVPKYQREYTWGQREWDLLFNDIIENDYGYFLGSIICIDTSSGERNSDTIFEVIDGQQRITTLSIFLACIFKKLTEFKDYFKEDEELHFAYLNLRRELISKTDDKNMPRLYPQIQHENQNDYFAILTDIGLLEGYQKKAFAKKRRLYRAFDRFNELIDELIGEQEGLSDEKKYKVLFELLKKFNSAMVVSIDVDSAKDAYMLFESLNNRGVPLSSIDLIKNMLIQYSEKDKKSDEAYTTWTNVLNYLGEEYSVQERFFRHYYNAFRSELNAPFVNSNNKRRYPLGLLATRTTLLDIYEKIVKKDYQLFLNGLLEKAKYYSVLINNAREEDQIEILREPLLDLERIQGAPSYALLLFLLSKRTELCISYSDIASIINYLVKFFARRNITDTPNTRNLDKIFLDIIEDITVKTGNDVISSIESKLTSVSADDQYFETKLNGPLYIENVDVTRFLLYYYEKKFFTKEIYTDLWARNEKGTNYIWTIEHIFPEGENVPQCWIDMIADGNKELADEYLEKYTHIIGNLTLTGYNSNLSNLSFMEKMNRKDKFGKDVGYKNGLALNKDVVDKTEWHKEDIEKRTEKLVKFYLDEFKL